MLMRMRKWPSTCFVLATIAGCATNGWSADNLSGQVSQNAITQNATAQETVGQDPSWPGAVAKSLTLTPGTGQFSADHLHFGRQVVLTLYNPNPYPMRFDTTQRLGKDYSWVVPANSQRTVAFRYWNPVSDEVKFLTYQDPSSLVISQGRVTQPQTEAIIGPQPSVSSLESTSTQPANTSSQELIGPPQPQNAQPPMRTQAKSAVRGYW